MEALRSSVLDTEDDLHNYVFKIKPLTIIILSIVTEQYKEVCNAVFIARKKLTSTSVPCLEEQLLVHR
jgi:hypothetical protein